MPLPFDRVWVTGASTGIGRAVCLELARQGARVAASARSVDKLDTLVAEAENLPGTIMAVPLDVTNPKANEDAVAHITEAWGGLDVALLNAGTYLPVDYATWNNEAFEQSMTLNVLGPVYAISAVLPVFQAQKKGHIAIVSSIAGVRALPTSAAYGTSKAAATYLAECLRIEQARSGIKAQVILPGFVKTPLTDKNEFPMPFRISSEDAARRIVKGLTASRFEITFPKRFTWLVKAFAALPDALYIPLIRRGTKSG